jgi:hypothetical protein
MRIGVVSMACSTAAPGSPLWIQYGCGPAGAESPGPCPAGYQLDDTGQICLPIGAVETIGGGNATIPPCLPAGSQGPLQPGQTYCPVPLPKDFPPSQGFCSPGTALYQNSICLPLTSPAWNQIPVRTVKPSIIPGIPDWALYSTVGVLALVVLMGGRR